LCVVVGGVGGVWGVGLCVGVVVGVGGVGCFFPVRVGGGGLSKISPDVKEGIIP